MRRPFSSNPDGPTGRGTFVDLRDFPAELQDELFFVTAFVDTVDSAVNLDIDGNELTPELQLIDARDDAITINTLPPFRTEVPFLDRYPVRGPFALAVANVNSNIVGYIEQAVDFERRLRPFSVDGETFSAAPVVLTGTMRTVTRIPEGVWCVSLYVTAGRHGTVEYRPDHPSGPSNYYGLFFGPTDSTKKGMARVLDRIPVRGPGVLRASGAADTLLYGFLST